MKTIKLPIFIIGILSSFLVTGCDNIDNTPGQYSNGIFVINEGAFGSSNCEVSFISNDNSVYNNLYAGNNNGLILGDVLQSMTIEGSYAYLIVNNSNKIEVVNINDLKSVATITGFSLPRYMVTHNGKGYVTEYTSYSSTGKVKVIDLSSNTIVDSVDLGWLPEQLMVVGNDILVANSGDTTLHLINTSTMAVTNIGNVDYPKYITQTNDGNIWVLYTGKPFWTGSNTDGGLLVLNSTATSVVKNITIGSTTAFNPSQLATDGTNLYYEYQSDIYKIDKSATVAPASPFIGSPAISLYGLNYYAANNTLLVADAKSFSTAGLVKRFDASSGLLYDTLVVGVAPNGFVFN